MLFRSSVHLTLYPFRASNLMKCSRDRASTIASSMAIISCIFQLCPLSMERYSRAPSCLLCLGGSGGSEGSDPASVIFDAVNAAKARNIDVLLCDTAGRLHNKKNLMEELKKINRIIDREFPDAHRENLVVLDATTGQNALQQAKEFGEVADLTGIILTKMDGTAKGGIAVAIQSQLQIPVKYIGVGETIEDLQKFDADQFVDALFSVDQTAGEEEEER